MHETCQELVWKLQAKLVKFCTKLHTSRSKQTGKKSNLVKSQQKHTHTCHNRTEKELLCHLMHSHKKHSQTHKMSASASAAPPVAAIYDSDYSPTMGEVSVVVDDDTTVVDDDDESDNDNNDDYDDNDEGETLDDAFFVPPGTS